MYLLKKKEKNIRGHHHVMTGGPYDALTWPMWQGNSNSPKSKRPVCALRIRPFEFPNLISIRQGATEEHVCRRLTGESVTPRPATAPGALPPSAML